MTDSKLTDVLDRFVNGATRRVAKTTSRRSFVTRLGQVLIGASVFPALPIARAAGHDGSFAEMGDEKSCDYWRYCAIDGFLCSCCGGSASTCPPGTEPSPVTWVGTCLNPADGKRYVISYNDCCGKASCGRCLCNRNEGDRPVYFPPKSNDINWCLGTSSQIYNCSTAIIVGKALD